jgi:hypothetical protein
MTLEYNTRVFDYTDRSDAAITVKRIDEPYGEATAPVVSVGCTLKGKPDAPTWVVHVPLALVPSVARAMLDEYEREEYRLRLQSTSRAAPGF